MDALTFERVSLSDAKASALTEPDPLMLAGTDPGSAQL